MTSIFLFYIIIHTSNFIQQNLYEIKEVHILRLNSRKCAFEETMMNME